MTTGSRIRIDGFADQGWDEELLERGEKPVGAEDEPFRVEIVGSNPAGPTKLLFAKNYKRKVAKLSVFPLFRKCLFHFQLAL